MLDGALEWLGALSWLWWTLAIVLGLVWLYGYARSRDAEEATEAVGNTVNGVVLGTVSALVVFLGTFADLVAGLGDVVGAHGGMAGQLLIAGVGYLGTTTNLLSSGAFLITAAAIIVAMLMLRRS